MRADRILSSLAVLGLAIASAVLLVAPAGADEQPTPTPSDGPTATPSSEIAVDDAVLRWGINNESNNRAFAPNTVNFFSAGRIPDPGQGNTTLPRSAWKQASGAVSLEKWNGRSYAPATWAGLSTDSSGRTLAAPTSGTFSNHRIVFAGGTGTVDREAGTARIAWDGDVSVLYYSGMSFFYLTDPVLDVADGRGTLTATMQGYATSREDASDWTLLPPASVRLADLPSVDLAELGFVAQPAYDGVVVTGVPQVTGGEHAGSFPQTFIDYADRLGTAAFWYSSNGATDAYKVPLPLSVGFDRDSAAPEPTPTQPTSTPRPVAPPTVKLPPTPTASPSATATPSATSTPAAPARPAPPAAALPAALAPPTATTVAQAAAGLPPATQLVAATPDAASSPTSPRSDRLWWAGGALLLGAAAVLSIPSIPRRTRKAAP